MSKADFDREFKRRENFKKKFEQQKKRKEINPLSKLNKDQLTAVHAKGINNLIIASAGTGKTSTIIGRVIYLLERGVKPEEIILLTFTSKAGKEMLDRLSKHFEEEIVSKIFAGTFHSFGKVLMNKAKVKTRLKTPKEMILLLKTILSDKAFKGEVDKLYSAKTIADYIGLYENCRKEDEKFDEWLGNKLSEKTNSPTSKTRENAKLQIAKLSIYQIIYDTYCQTKIKNDICDFNDLLKYIKTYFKEKRNYIKQLIVDEYQDTNALQNSIMKFLQEKGSSIFAVGDYDQSIYGFNGSNIEIIREFEKIYPKVQIHKLCKNYRSSKHILELANNCISFNERIIEKELVPMRQGSFPKPELIIYETISQQNENLPLLIEKSGFEYNEIAVLARSNNSSNLIEAILIEQDIPVVRVKSGSFFEGEDIATLVSIFKIATNSEITVIDYLNISYFTSEIPKNVLLKLFEYRKSMTSINIFHQYTTNNKNKKEVQELYSLLLECNNISNPLTIFKLIYETSLYESLVNRTVKKAEAFSNESRDVILNQIQKKHELLLKIAKSCTSISMFIKKLLFTSKEEENDYGVKLMTVHASKGLEFKYVIVIDLTETKFPNKKLSEGEKGIEEERRLFYVATTRAEDKLTLTSYKVNDLSKRGGKEEISRFVGESGVMVT